jgi:hypothetical protein
LRIHAALQPDVTRAELVGEYSAHCGDGTDTLQLSPDGTYVHRWKETDAAWRSQSDDWQMETDPKFREGCSLSVRNYSDRFPLHRSELSATPERRSGFYCMEVRRAFSGHVQLNLDPDVTCYYEKH